MEIEQAAFEAFMLAYHEYGGTGLGFRKCLQAYESAKLSNKHSENECKHEFYPEPSAERCAICGKIFTYAGRQWEMGPLIDKPTQNPLYRGDDKGLAEDGIIPIKTSET